MRRMDALGAFFLRRGLLVNLIAISVVILGVSTLSSIQKEGFPSVSQNQAVITTIYPGASAQDVEANVTIPLEEAIAEVSGVQEYSSVSRENMSTITVNVDDNASAKEFERIYNDLSQAMDQVTDLPDDVDGRPRIRQITSDDLPIIELALSGSGEVLRPFTAKLERNLRKVSGVASVKTVGISDLEAHILVDSQKAKAFEVDLQSIYRAIQGRNIQGSGGSYESFTSEKKIVSLNQFQKPEDVLDTNIRRSTDGHGVRLADVATIEVVPKDVNLIVRNNGAPGASVLVTKTKRADTLDTIDRLHERLQDIPLPDGVSLKMLNDQSKLTRNRIQLLGGNALMGLGLVAIVLLFVFDLRTAVWTSFGIPFSLLGLFIFLPMLGITLNALTLGGCVIVLGMLVDDAIVVAEQVSHYKEQGYQGFEAGMKGLKDVWQPIVASTATSVIAFSPIAQMGGLPGKFVWLIPVVIAVALMASLFESFFVLPSHLVHGKKPKKIEKRAFVIKAEELYRKTLNKSLRWRYGIIAIFAMLLLSAGYVAKDHLVKDPFPQESAEGFTMLITLPHGSPDESTIQEISKVEAALDAIKSDEMEGYSIRIGTHTLSQTVDQGTQTNLAAVFVYLTPYSGRERTAQGILDVVREQLTPNLTEGVEVSLALKRLGPPLGRPFEVRVISANDQLRDAKVAEVKTWLKGIDGLYDIEDDRIRGRDEIRLQIDYDTLAISGLRVTDVLNSLRIAYDGLVASSIVWRGNTIDFRVRLNEQSRGKIDNLGQLPVMNSRGKMINLKEVISLTEGPSNAEIRHIDGDRATAVFGQLDKEKILPAEVMALFQEKFKSTLEVQYDFAGEPVENQKIFGNLGQAGVLALVGTYMVITLIFSSIVRPLLVMTAIPFGLVGVIYALFAHGMPLSMFAAISIVGLTGIIVNDSIVMIYTIVGLEKEEGGLTNKAIVEGAVSRLRPITLTSVTTILGLVPTAYGFGGFDAFISPMCLALGYGLMFGTVILLLLIPCLYRIGLDLHILKGKAFGMLSKAEASNSGS